MATMSRKSTRFRMFSYKKGRIAPALSKEYRSGPEVFGDRAHYRLDRNMKHETSLAPSVSSIKNWTKTAKARSRKTSQTIIVDILLMMHEAIVK